MRFGKFRFFTLLSALAVALTMVSVDFAEARRGGSFGSRGTRTFQAPATTNTAPSQAAPVGRTMTPAPAPGAAARQPAAQQRPGLFGGLGGSLMRGLMIGGLIGMLMGYGFGGMAGMLGFLVQALLIGMLAWLALAFFRSRRTPAMATAGAGANGGQRGADMFGGAMRRDATAGGQSSGQSSSRAGGFSIPGIGGAAAAAQAAPQTRDITLDQADLETFERMLAEVQAAFAGENHAELRRLSTPEMVSFFSEELAENAQNGVRNEVRDVRLLQADIAEAWSEGAEEYATAAFRYEAVDVLRDRDTGAVTGGVEEPTETVEIWTFVRRSGSDWKLSAIQEA